MAKNTIIKRYDELAVNDTIIFYGAEVIITDIKYFPYNEPAYKEFTDKVVRFTIKPANDEAIELLGKFYSHGTYGGVGCLEATVLVKEA